MEHPENEVEPALSEFDAVNEASRCRKCASCYECDICMPACVYKNALLTDKSGSYLLKLPKKLSREIYDSENASCTISVSGRKEKQFTVTALTPRIDRDYCIACGRCASSCAYRAIRAELSLNDSAYYKIEHDICRSCGRCVSVCPSQAITLDRFTDSELEADILTSLHHNNGIVVFGSHWDMDVYNGEDRVIEMMSSECVSPLLIIHTLSLGAKAVVILNGMNPHYLPADSEVPGIVSSVKELLVLSGINTERVAFCQPDEAARILPWVKETFRYHAPETFSNSNVNRLMRTCFELSEYTAHTSFPANNLELHNKVLLAAKVPDYSSLIESINYLSLKFRLGMISPDYEDIQNVGFMKYLSGKLPQLSLKKPSVIGVHNEFMPIQYVEIITSILAGVRNCAVISIPDPGQISSDHITITSDSRKKAVSIFRTAERLGADTVITTSPMCLAWLKAINNPLTLQISSVSVTDIFTFIADIIKEADNE